MKRVLTSFLFLLCSCSSYLITENTYDEFPSDSDIGGWSRGQISEKRILFDGVYRRTAEYLSVTNEGVIDCTLYECDKTENLLNYFNIAGQIVVEEKPGAIVRRSENQSVILLNGRLVSIACSISGTDLKYFENYFIPQNPKDDLPGEIKYFDLYENVFYSEEGSIFASPVKMFRGRLAGMNEYDFFISKKISEDGLKTACDYYLGLDGVMIESFLKKRIFIIKKSKYYEFACADKYRIFCFSGVESVEKCKLLAEKTEKIINEN